MKFCVDFFSLSSKPECIRHSIVDTGERRTQKSDTKLYMNRLTRIASSKIPH
jgi:hypothetical protein